MKTLKALIRNEDGATLIEYSLLSGLLAITVLAAVAVLGGNLSAFFIGLAAKMGQLAANFGD